MDNSSPVKALAVVAAIAVVSSALIASAVVLLRPIQRDNQLLERSRNIMALTGLVVDGASPSDEETLSLFRQLDARLLDLDAAGFSDAHDPNSFDQRSAVNRPELRTEIPADGDLASLRQRSRYTTAYLVWSGDQLDRIILPVRGAGMWSMLYGYVALESDLNTIAAALFYEHAETPGLGDQITRADWLAQWRGREIYGTDGAPRFAVSGSAVVEGSSLARYEVDGLTGATITANAVTNLVRYWFGEHGYGPLLHTLRETAPTPGPGP